MKTIIIIGKALVLAVAVVIAIASTPFWFLGFALECIAAAFQHGRRSFRNLESAWGKS